KLKHTGISRLNVGLVLIKISSLLPAGLLQFQASASTGVWYARGDNCMQQDLLQALRWIRTFGDVVFIVGALAVAWQVTIGLFKGSATQPTLTNPPMKHKPAN